MNRMPRFSICQVLLLIAVIAIGLQVFIVRLREQKPSRSSELQQFANSRTLSLFRYPNPNAPYLIFVPAEKHFLLLIGTYDDRFEELGRIELGEGVWTVVASRVGNSSKKTLSLSCVETGQQISASIDADFSGEGFKQRQSGFLLLDDPGDSEFDSKGHVLMTLTGFIRDDKDRNIVVLAKEK